LTIMHDESGINKSGTPEPEIQKDPISRCWIVAIAVVIITYLVFAQTLNFGFVNWDDDKHILDNRYMYPKPNAGYFWRQPFDNLYIPVTYTLWAVLVRLAKTTTPIPLPGFSHTIQLNPNVFHSATLLLHLVNVILVYFLLRRFVKSDIACGAGALMFGIHPLQVESVAWISETRGTLSTAFGLLAIHTYLRGWDCKGIRTQVIWFSLASLLFVAGLLSKPSLVVLPVILVIIDLFLVKRPIRMTLPLVMLWLLIAGFVVHETQSAQPVPQTLTSIKSYSALVASDAIGFYVTKLIAPFNLGPDYGRTPMWLIRQPWMVASILTLLSFVGIIFITMREKPFICASVCIFLVALLPVLGFVPFIYQLYSTVADRYAYLAMLGPALLIAWSLDRFQSRRLFLTASVVLAIFCAVSIHQVSYWRNTYTLFRHNLDVNPASALSYNNLATAFDHDGDAKRAILLYKKSLAMQPTELAYANLGLAYIQTKAFDDAIAVLRLAANLDPYNPEVHNSLAAAYGSLNRYSEAQEEIQCAIRLEPSADELGLIYVNLEYTDYKLGHYQDVIETARKVISITPYDAESHYIYALALSQINNTDESLKQLTVAERLKPRLVYERAITDGTPIADLYVKTGLLQLGRHECDKAAISFKIANRFRPEDARIVGDIGYAYLNSNKIQLASTYLLHAVLLAPRSAPAHVNMAALEMRQFHRLDAIAECKNALNINPRYVPAQLMLRQIESSP